MKRRRIPAPQHLRALDGGVEDGVTWCVVRSAHGRIDGYVLLPEQLRGPSLAKLSWVDMRSAMRLTYVDHDGWVGFHTHHANDLWTKPDPRDHSWVRHWDQQQVVDEAKALARMVAKAAGS